jgi:hypothetical protein
VVGRENGAEEVLGEAVESVSVAAGLPAEPHWMRRERCRWMVWSAQRQPGGCCG